MIMKRTKTVSVLLVMAGLLASGLSVTAAQTNTLTGASTNSAPSIRHTGPMSVDGQLNRLNEQLHLTDAQKPKVKAVLEEQNKQIQKLRELAPDDRRTKMRSLQIGRASCRERV